jgi:hypothetical protein
MPGPHGCCANTHLEATFSIDALADSGVKVWLDAVRSCTPIVLVPRAFTASVAPRRTASVLLVAAPVLLLVPRSGRSWVSAPHLGAPTRTAAARRRGTKGRTVVAVRMRRGPFCTVAFEAGKKIASASAPSAFSGCERTSAIHGERATENRVSIVPATAFRSAIHRLSFFGATLRRGSVSARGNLSYC